MDNKEFIMLTKEDAKNILWMLDEAIRRLHGCLETDADIKVFGDKAISYERLIDKLEPIYADADCTIVMNPEIHNTKKLKIGENAYVIYS